MPVLYTSVIFIYTVKILPHHTIPYTTLQCYKLTMNRSTLYLWWILFLTKSWRILMQSIWFNCLQIDTTIQNVSKYVPKYRVDGHWLMCSSVVGPTAIMHQNWHNGCQPLVSCTTRFQDTDRASHVTFTYLLMLKYCLPKIFI